MDAILTQLLSFPAHPPPNPPLTDAEYDKQAKAHIQNLSKIPSNKFTSGAIGSNHPIDVRLASALNLLGEADNG